MKLLQNTLLAILIMMLTSGLAESKMRGQDIPVDAVDLTDSNNSVLGNSTQVPDDVFDLTDSNDTVSVNGDFIYSRKIPSRSREILSLLSGHQDVDLIIRYKKGASFEEKGLIEKKLGRIGAAKARGKKSDISSFVDDQSVESVEVDQPMTLSFESVPWNVNLTNAPIAWNLTKGNGVSIAILDSGIAPHPDLQIAGGTSVISDNYSDTYGHGTAVAGVLSASLNDEGLVGVAPEADIYAVKITDGPTGMISDALAGLDWAITNNMSIISMSFGFSEYSPAFASAVQQAYTNGALLIAAAGNENGEIDFPARYDLVIAVGSVDSNLERASTSNYGPELDLIAPGDEINTTSLNSGYSILSGTSLAVPHVAGIATLIKSANQTLTNTEIRNIIRNAGQDLGEPGKDDYYGHGLIQYSTFLNLTVIEELPTYYTIYNLSYVNDSQQLTYWKNGNGSYQQENFTIGLFLINITRGNRTGVEIINVTNNGTIQLKTPYIYFDDDFTIDSSTAIDGKAFVNDRLQTELFNSDVETDAYCFDFTNDDVFDKCGYYSSDELTSCIDYANTLTGDLKAFYNVCEGYPNNCVEDPDFNILWNLTTTSKTYHNTQMVSYNDCDNSANERDWNQDMEWYYVFDQRRAYCTSNTTYKMDGQYSTGAWNTYKSTLNCGSGTTCDYSVDNEVTTTNRSTSINPCRLNQGQTCTASEQCLNGLNCSSSICTNITTTNQTDLQIIELIPIQVLPNVPMILGKSGYVIVRVFNNGTMSATGNVSVSFNGDSLTKTLDTTNPQLIPSNQSAVFKFNFKPISQGTNLFINATVVTS
ncbi:MAG: S8 family serine peptidase [Nanoarchaeota archaeon]